MPGGKGLQGECRTVRFAGGSFSWVESSSLGYTAHPGPARVPPLAQHSLLAVWLGAQGLCGSLPTA